MDLINEINSYVIGFNDANRFSTKSILKIIKEHIKFILMLTVIPKKEKYHMLCLLREELMELKDNLDNSLNLLKEEIDVKG
jgi:hypothetical protein